MRRVTCVWVISAMATLAAAGASAAAPAPTVPVGVVLEAPSGFGESCCLAARSGSWLGPAYAGSQGEDTGARARIDWSISPSVRAAGADAAARAALSKGWVVVEAGVTFLPHTVGSRAVGTIPASYFVAQELRTARYELVVAAAVYDNVFARVGLRVFGTRGGAHIATSAFTVDGAQSTQWNLEALQETMRTLRLEGNLPPSTVALRRRGAALSGSVLDVNGHPLVRTRVTVRRKVGSRWNVAAVTRTTERGTFVLRPRLAAGLYRASASVAGLVARSSVVRR